MIQKRRMPHPVTDRAIAAHNSRTICEPRGYCGPFINEHIYDDFPDPVWRGMGECVQCGNTVNVSAHEMRRLRVQEPPTLKTG